MLTQNVSNQFTYTTGNVEEYSFLDIEYERHTGVAWYSMHASPRPCFTLDLVGEIQHWLESVDATIASNDVRYIVMGSSVPGVFNLGGDLNSFLKMIRNKDKEGLMRYAIACIDALHLIHTGLGRKVSSISLVQGDALGGGLEVAISSDVLIAERGTKMGFPEILFNLFPGMGAYSFLSRKIGAAKAEHMILSGHIHTAEELYEMGLVDVLAEPGMGRQAVYEYVKHEDRAQNGFRAFRKAKQYCNPVSYEELLQITTIWAEAALNIGDRDLRMMERLVSRQSTKVM
jgi:DSF synthase